MRLQELDLSSFESKFDTERDYSKFASEVTVPLCEMLKMVPCVRSLDMSDFRINLRATELIAESLPGLQKGVFHTLFWVSTYNLVNILVFNQWPSATVALRAFWYVRVL